MNKSKYQSLAEFQKAQQEFDSERSYWEELATKKQQFQDFLIANNIDLTTLGYIQVESVTPFLSQEDSREYISHPGSFREKIEIAIMEAAKGDGYGVVWVGPDSKNHTTQLRAVIDRLKDFGTKVTLRDYGTKDGEYLYFVLDEITRAF